MEPTNQEQAPQEAAKLRKLSQVIQIDAGKMYAARWKRR